MRKYKTIKSFMAKISNEDSAIDVNNFIMVEGAKEVTLCDQYDVTVQSSEISRIRAKCCNGTQFARELLRTLIPEDELSRSNQKMLRESRSSTIEAIIRNFSWIYFLFHLTNFLNFSRHIFKLFRSYHKFSSNQKGLKN